MSLSGLNYNLHTLGWRDFQNLCATILREILGQTFEQFAETSDAGRDGAFFGSWRPHGAEEMTGSFVFQCKFTSKPGSLLQRSHLADEFVKAKRLARKKLCRNYILITNASVRAPVVAELKYHFESIPGLNRFVVFDGNWLTSQIKENQRLRILVPRVYGLGDLTEILDDRIYEQAKEVLSWLGDELARFVVTDAHHRSVKALQEKRFVFLLGDAGSGKSTIAAALALAAADKWQARVVKVADPSDFKFHSNPHEKNQFFWVDDVFGQLKYERERASKWNQLLPNLAAAINRGAVAIFTSRSYIYRDAIEDLKDSTFPLLKESQVVIEVADLSESEREQILYNHLRLGNQSREFRASLKAFLGEVARSPHFLPELARRLGHASFTKQVSPTRNAVMHFLENPEEYLHEQFEKFGDMNRAALALVFMKNGALRAPLTDLSTEDEQTLRLFDSSIGNTRKALKALEGPYIAKQIQGGDTIYRFKHPTIRDGFGKFISGDPNLMDCYLAGTTTEMLLQEVSCGETKSEGGGLVVPCDRYPVVLKRLQQLLKEPDGQEKVVEFLNSRCADDFLRVFVHAENRFVSKLSFGHWLAWCPVVALYARLHRVSLLNEKYRKKFFEEARGRVYWGPQWRFLRKDEIRSLLQPSELRSLRVLAKTRFGRRKLDETIRDWKEAWRDSSDETAEEYFWSIKVELDSLGLEFSKNRTLRRRFRSAVDRINKLTTELDEERADSEDSLKAEVHEKTTPTIRSVFDDVDA